EQASQHHGGACAPGFLAKSGRRDSFRRESNIGTVGIIMSLNLFAIDIRLENDVVLARQKARTVAAALKFDSQDQTRIATAVSEIARNTFQYGGGGRAEFRLETNPERMLLVTLRDSRRGIEDLSRILDGKYVSHTGMGVGIIGAKRLMDYFHVDTKAGQGTTVVLGKK